MSKSQAVPASEFTRNFGRYRMLVQKATVPVTSHGQITGYFISPDEYEEFERFQSRRRVFATQDLSNDKVDSITSARMDARHDHLNSLLDSE
jgi:hypothetical protein